MDTHRARTRFTKLQLNNTTCYLCSDQLVLVWSQSFTWTGPTTVRHKSVYVPTFMDTDMDVSACVCRNVCKSCTVVNKEAEQDDHNAVTVCSRRLSRNIMFLAQLLWLHGAITHLPPRHTCSSASSYYSDEMVKMIKELVVSTARCWKPIIPKKKRQKAKQCEGLCKEGNRTQYVRADGVLYR